MNFGIQAAWHAFVDRGTGRGCGPSAGGGPGTAGAGGQLAYLLCFSPWRPAETVAATRRHALQSAAEARRGRGASSATGHPDVVRAGPLPIDAVHVWDVLAVAPQLWCPETGRPARGRRPASLGMAVHAVPRARSNRLRCLGAGLCRIKRGQAAGAVPTPHSRTGCTPPQSLRASTANRAHCGESLGAFMS